jgi:hypothetical protein
MKNRHEVSRRCVKVSGILYKLKYRIEEFGYILVVMVYDIDFLS